MEPKNQVIWTTPCKVMVKYISIYFDIFYEKLVSFGLIRARKTKIFSLVICLGLLLAFVLNGSQRRNPLKKMFFFLSEK